MQGGVAARAREEAGLEGDGVELSAQRIRLLLQPAEGDAQLSVGDALA